MQQSKNMHPCNTALMRRSLSAVAGLLVTVKSRFAVP